MPDNIVSEQTRSEREKFENELSSILKACENAGVLVKVLGSMAFQIHCPRYQYLQTATKQPYGDIDLATYSEFSKQIREILTTLGYVENREIFVLSEGQRAIFYKSSNKVGTEVFYEKLDFCHVIPWKGRLSVDSPTIPLAELFLEKMQIVHISERDIINVIMLLLEHPIGETDRETINIKLITQLCANEWGLWRTTTLNLNKVKQFSQQYSNLSLEQKSKVESQVDAILLRLYTEPKSLAWKVRDHMGDRVKWYKDVDDI